MGRSQRANSLTAALSPNRAVDGSMARAGLQRPQLKKTGRGERRGRSGSNRHGDTEPVMSYQEKSLREERGMEVDVLPSAVGSKMPISQPSLGCGGTSSTS